jgi:hypothetical protein
MVGYNIRWVSVFKDIMMASKIVDELCILLTILEPKLLPDFFGFVCMKQGKMTKSNTHKSKLQVKM